MLERRFIQCDVFSETPFMGNGLAVVLDADGLSDRQMQDFAAWTNLSETTYLLPPSDPQADYRLRIFTPTQELAFAGHPTLGSCAAWLHAGGTSRDGKTVVQQCKIGNVVIDISGTLPGFVAPPTRISPMPQTVQDRILSALGIDPQALRSAAILDNGSVWHLLEFDTATTIMAVTAARVTALPGLGIGLMAPRAPDAPSQFDIRMLSERTSRYEDPITGSLNADQGRLRQPTVMAQGAKVGRDGQVHLLPRPDGSGQVLVAGRSHIVIDGKVRI